MRINEESINHNAVRIIKDLVKNRYDMITEATVEERDCFLMTVGEIAGVIEMAEVMKEVLKA